MDTDKNAQGCYNNDVKGISTDRFSFEYFIRNDLLYVDKTMYVHDLVSHPERNFFFSPVHEGSARASSARRCMLYSMAGRIFSRGCT